MLVPIALAGYLHTVGADQPSAAPHEQMTVAEVSAEFARAISLGFVDADGDWQPAGSMPAGRLRVCCTVVAYKFSGNSRGQAKSLG